jgi:hypothetical protein
MLPTKWITAFVSSRTGKKKQPDHKLHSRAGSFYLVWTVAGIFSLHFGQLYAVRPMEGSAATFLWPRWQPES